jgi:hypothetical protein
MYLFRRSAFVGLFFLLFVVTIVVFSPASASAQAVARNGASATDAPAKTGHWAYRKILLGMKADEARKTLGDPKDKGDDQDLYLFTDEELAQIYYDANHQINAISVTYYKDLSKAPSAKDVLGEDAPPKADGSVFKTVRFPKAGYSVSYSKTSGDSPSVSITFQKL